MSVLGKIAGAATSAIDMKVGGLLTKAELEVHTSDDRASELAGKKLKFQFNPETIKMTRKSSLKNFPVKAGKGTGNTKQAKGLAQASTFSIPEVIFDTYELKPQKSVYTEYVQLLEKFAGYDKHKHAPAWLMFNWGDFTKDRSQELTLSLWLKTLDVTYTMFLPNGKPVRAKVKMTFEIGVPPEKLGASAEEKSPDHAKLVTVKRGDTLADIAFVEYDDSNEWRRIADFNDIDDPMSLRPGRKLLIPPIL